MTTWPTCRHVVGAIELDDWLANPTPEIMSLAEAEYRELEEMNGQEALCGCPLLLPGEQETGECLYCKWERENGRDYEIRQR